MKSGKQNANNIVRKIKFISRFLKNISLIKTYQKKTIQKHVENAGLYINEYLLYYDAVSMENGVNDTFGFVSFYIRKCSSLPSSLKTVLANLKKFYQCMLQYEKIKEEDYKELVQTIKIYSSDWIEEVAEYNASLYGDDHDDDYDELLCARRQI